MEMAVKALNLMDERISNKKRLQIEGIFCD
jgi:hypothetical protein